ncbi:MAG TPA: YcgN family cysteine cluster protein [Alphaproteobacteria bacterium]|nr:hypothetical protein [Paracoccaceae bacterium]RCL81205.1 MAG: YcgN family cysteine cluster protein [SAR116 cluster bacterium]RPH14322.1 MAG: YcgN family cysteine cluster protein [Alphaproteobacteria bacterium TMED150]HCY48626.1 YcgN family cysteine cluster protein [Alphaproteobacteria bacterium]
MVKEQAGTMTKFWEEKSLNDMSPEEWESLCDHCGRCCLVRLIDDDTEELLTTNIVCRAYDQQNKQCGCYAYRHKEVPECLKLTAENVLTEDWIPSTCAYRRLAEGRDLAFWHPLLAGDSRKMDELGISITNRVVGEQTVRPENYEDHVASWPIGPDVDL